MNGILNSEATLFQFDKHSDKEHVSLEMSSIFSDLVPSFATVESVSNPGSYSFIQLNPMTASHNSNHAAMISTKEIISHNTRENTFGTDPFCTPTVAFFY